MSASPPWNDGTEAIAFVEAPLPQDVDSVRLGGIEYVRAVVAATLPEGVAAIRIRSVAVVHLPKI